MDSIGIHLCFAFPNIDSDNLVTWVTIDMIRILNRSFIGCIVDQDEAATYTGGGLASLAPGGDAIFY